MKRVASLLAAASILGGGAAVALGSAAAGASPGAHAASSLPTLEVTLSGKQGVSVSGSKVSGAVTVVSTQSSGGPGFYGLVQLHPGVTFQQAAGAVQSHHGDLDALTPYATLSVSAYAPGTLQTVLTPGNWVALNLTGNGQPGFAPFTVTQSSSPAALPRARSTESTIEFAFRGPSVLHDGTMVRVRNAGYLVHMQDLIGVRNRATGRKVVALLRAGKDRKAQKLASHRFVSLIGPASPGALQQAVLQAKHGYYVQACFMDTGDGREHTRLGMVRLIRIVK